MKYRGWSQLEILTTIAVVGVLGMLAFLGYSNLQDKAHLVECSVKMRKISQAILIYAADHQGSFPQSSHSGRSWAQAIAEYLNEPVLNSPLDYRSRDSFVCPALKSSNKEYSQVWSYGINVFFELSSTMRYTPAGLPILGSRDSYKGSPQTWHRVGDVPNLSRTVLIAENTHAHADHFMAHQWSSNLTAANAVASKRHGGKSNFAFADGHVETLSIESTFNQDKGVDLWNPSLAR